MFPRSYYPDHYFPKSYFPGIATEPTPTAVGRFGVESLRRKRKKIKTPQPINEDLPLVAMIAYLATLDF